MTKRTKIIIASATFCLLVACILILCLGSLSRKAKIAVEKYNEAASAYNVATNSYNSSLDVVEQANIELDAIIKTGRTLLESNAIPFDDQCKTKLEQALTATAQARIEVSARLPLYEEMTIPQDATDEQLKEITATAASLTRQMENTTVPEPLAQPDYVAVQIRLKDTIAAYEKSVLIQQQVTAPEDAFVVDCLKQIDTVLAVGTVTKSNDSNGLLGTEGGYIGCIYFSDSRVDKEKLDLKPGDYTVIKMGNVGGGAVEVFATVEDAEARNLYLATFDNTDLKPGSHCVVGTIVVRTSPYLTDDQQIDLTNKIIELFTMLAN